MPQAEEKTDMRRARQTGLLFPRKEAKRMGPEDHDDEE